MKISIIGSNGYLGKNLTEYLFLSGHDLSLYDISDTSMNEMLKYKQIDISDKNDIKKVDFQSDVIVFLAGMNGTTTGFEKYESFVKINEISFLNFLTEYVDQKSKALIIYPSSRLVYKGRSGSITEESELLPRTVYAVNKYSCERYLEIYHNCYGVRYCILRISIPFGSLSNDSEPNMTMKFLLSDAQRNQPICIYGDGTQRRTFTHVKSICEIIHQIALYPEEIDDIYNVGGEDFSLIELANLIAKKYKVDIQHINWPHISKQIETENTVFDDKKLMNKFHYKYNMSIEKWIDELK